MIAVTLVLPNGQRRQGKVDPSASAEEILRAIVLAYNLGDPKAFTLAIGFQFRATALSDYTLSDGDTIYLMDSQALKGPAFAPNE